MPETLPQTSDIAPKRKRGARGRGRPMLSDTTQLTKAVIFDQALEFTRKEPLQDVTITGLARHFDVTASLIHYLIPRRDGLISGAMNAFYRRLCAGWPEPEGHWRRHLEQVARHVRRYHLEYRGVVAYTATHSRHRLIQIVEEGETDWGLVYLDRLLQAAMTMGVGPAETTLFCETLIDFLLGHIRTAAGARLPGAHESYLRGIFAQLDPQAYPGIDFVGDELFKTQSETLFEQGMGMLLDSFEIHRARMI